MSKTYEQLVQEEMDQSQEIASILDENSSLSVLTGTSIGVLVDTLHEAGLIDRKKILVRLIEKRQQLLEEAKRQIDEQERDNHPAGGH